MENKPTHIIFQFDYLTDIQTRLSNKHSILKISTLCKESGVSRRAIETFMSGKIPNISFENIAKLYKYLEEHNI